MQGDLVAHGGARRRVVLTMPLPAAASARLHAAAGDDVELVDVRDADGTEEIVVTTSVSRQLVARLRTAFPAARLLVVELEDLDHDVRFGGPVTRSLQWGADGYYVASSLDQLATFLGTAPDPRARPERPSELPNPEELELDEIIDVIIRTRATGAR